MPGFIGLLEPLKVKQLVLLKKPYDFFSKVGDFFHKTSCFTFLTRCHTFAMLPFVKKITVVKADAATFFPKNNKQSPHRHKADAGMICCQYSPSIF
jgi:hypothetical protein